MKLANVALLAGVAMFGVVFTVSGIGGVIAVIAHGIDLDGAVILIILKKSAIGGAVVGVSSFLLVLFGSHRKIGRN